MSTALGDPAQDNRRWAGRTADERAEQRRHQLLEAAYELLGTTGAASVTVRAVTRRAALSPRYFYESFADREHLLRAVFDERFDGIKRAVAEQMAASPADFLSQARASIDATARCLQDDPRLGRALMREAIGEPALREHALQALPEWVLGVAQLALGPDLPRDLKVLELQTLAVSGMQLAVLMAWSEGTLGVTREELVEGLLRMMRGVIA